VIQFIQYSDKWTKIGVNIGISFGDNQGNFQLHWFTTSENIAKSFRRGLLFWLTL